jgi:antirestriction protein ArdC
MLCSATGVATEASLRDDSAAYIAGWLKALGDERKPVVTAASQAERAADHVRSHRPRSRPGLCTAGARGWARLGADRHGAGSGPGRDGAG